MKNLFYKELKLSMHPLVYVFVFAFPLMILIPSYPLFISCIYLCSTYPIIFLGSNKGQQSNDIYFTCLLPIKKEDVIKARMSLLLFIQLASLGMILALSPLAKLIGLAMPPEENVSVGLSIDGVISLVAFALVGYSIYDFFYLIRFYKNGRSILLQTLVGMLAFIIFLSITTLALPLAIPSYFALFCESPIWLQLIFFGIACVFYFFMHWLTFFISNKRFQKVDL